MQYLFYFSKSHKSVFMPIALMMQIPISFNVLCTCIGLAVFELAYQKSQSPSRSTAGVVDPTQIMKISCLTLKRYAMIMTTNVGFKMTSPIHASKIMNFRIGEY